MTGKPDQADGYLVVGSRRLALDADGHLADRNDWDESVAEALARADGVGLEADHWWLIRFARSHFERYDTPPLMRVIVARLKKEFGPEKGTSRHLYRLFPDGPVRLACKYAGLPRPESCI